MATQTITLYRFWWMNGGRRHHHTDSPYDWKSQPEQDDGWKSHASDPLRCGHDAHDIPLATLDTRQVQGAVVRLEEEYGYRHWLWYTQLRPEALADFWTELESVEPFYIDPTRRLPGRLVDVLWHGENVFSTWEAGLSRPRQAYRLAGPVWRGHLFREDDTYLVTPEGERLHHAGFVIDPDY